MIARSLGSQLLACLALCAWPALPMPGQERKPAAESSAIDPRLLIWLIEQLGSEEFAQREVAIRVLRSLGEPALCALRRAARNHSDTEVRYRAAQVIHDIETRFRDVTSRA